MPPQESINELFTWASLGTLAGASAAVYIICGTLQRAFDFNPKWLALLVSILVHYLVLIFTRSGDKGAAPYVIALFNSCLTYMTAVGANTIAKPGKPGTDAAGAGAHPPTGPVPIAFREALPLHNVPRKFNSGWW
jgi:ABC-type Fe3+-siderophore transport system permease subunit